MAAWRDKQTKDYGLPSDLDKLKEIRGRHMQPQSPSGPDAAETRTTGRSSGFRFFALFVIVLLAQTGLLGFMIFRQQQDFSARIETMKIYVDEQLQKFGAEFKDIRSEMEELENKMPKNPQDMTKKINQSISKVSQNLQKIKSNLDEKILGIKLEINEIRKEVGKLGLEKKNETWQLE